MIKVTKVKFSYGETRSINFQSRRIDVGLEAEVREGEAYTDELAILQERCRGVVKEVFAQLNRDEAIKDLAKEKQ